MVVKKPGVKKSGKKANNAKVETSTKKKNLVPMIIGAVVLIILIGLLVVQFTKAKVTNGDRVVVDYTGYLDNGKVFDTSDQAIGTQAGLNKQAYQPLTFTVGDQQVIPGFEKALLDLSVGDKKRFTLTPDQAYGMPKPELFKRNIPRNLNSTRFFYVNNSEYVSTFGEQPIIGKIIKKQGLLADLKVDNVSEGNVTLEYNFVVGQKLNSAGTQWEFIIAAINDKQVIIRQNPKVGDQAINPITSSIVTVVKVDSDTFDIDANNPLAGKSLTFDITVKEIKKASK